MLETSSAYCSYCGEPIELVLDVSGGAQDYTEDCSVCCQPMQVALWVADDGSAWTVELRREDD
ncbi:Cysteine-rich CPXCG [Atopomonas hussainii]|uniref:Cysteine-rich CPXCG n=1 Tax=Atopomonas hussainii TaxID=1429083 RepID=A0A1H7RX64_9GAMM|nr:CPXCG motif-containing cysteine-rich protein [Atopomonas hussainii]SEL64619.1 Cysteine-rich CPXCG [Atopomonas hussainii]